MKSMFRPTDIMSSLMRFLGKNRETPKIVTPTPVATAPAEHAPRVHLRVVDTKGAFGKQGNSSKRGGKVLPFQWVTA